MRDFIDLLPVPEILEHALVEQRSHVPDDAEVLDRLFNYLKFARPTTQEIKEVVLEFYLIDERDIRSRCRVAAYVWARHMICYLCRKYTRSSLALIARRAGYTDHSSVVHGVQKVTALAVSRAIVRDDIDLLKLKLAEKMMRRTDKDIGRC